MLKRIYPIVLGVYTVLIVSKAVCITFRDVNGFLNIGFGRMLFVVVHNVSTSVTSFVSSLF